MDELNSSQQIILRAQAKALGLGHYFTGKPCKNGHIALRHTACGRCIVCRNEWNKEWIKRNPEKTKEQKRKTRNKNIDAARERTIRWRLTNPDKVKEYRVANRDRDRATKVEYEKKNKERIAERFKAYRANNLDKVRMWQHKRRALKILQTPNGDHYSTEQIDRLFVLQKHRCANCTKSIRDSYHIDHIQPLARGGSNSIENIQLLCPTCNIKKKAKDPFQWANENGRLL